MLQPQLQSRSNEVITETCTGIAFASGLYGCRARDESFAWLKVNGLDSSLERGVIWPEGKLKGDRGETGVESAEESGEVGRDELGGEGEFKDGNDWRTAVRKLRWLFKAAFCLRTRARSSFSAEENF